MEQFKNIFIDDVKSLKRDNLNLKLRVQELENEMETIKRMLKIILTKNKPTDKEALVIQRYWKSKQIKKRQLEFYTKYFSFKKWRSNIVFKQKIKMAQYVTCTPINLKNKFFKEQYDKFEKYNCQMKWDDTASNNSSVGNLFAFVQSDNNMKIHWITKIGDKTDREKHWTERERNVVFLSKEYFEMTWNEYKEKNGYKETFKMIGTQRLKWKY